MAPSTSKSEKSKLYKVNSSFLLNSSSNKEAGLKNPKNSKSSLLSNLFWILSPKTFNK